MNRPCYYAGKILIPGCLAVAHSNDITDCTCNKDDFMTNLIKRIEKLENEFKEFKGESK